MSGRLLESWNSLSASRRLLLALTGGAVVGLGLLLYSWSSSTQYVTLYSGLDAQDSGAITDHLRSQGVAYRIEGGGSTILVPEADLDQARVDLAVEGLPEGGSVGFEIFEGNAFTATDFVQRLNFQRGLQGELQRTIETFRAVENARVHIVLPERSLFRDDEQPATASVVLQMRQGMTLSASEVAGVAHLVSGAVEGLDREQVTILDTDGRVIFDGAEAAQDGGLGATVGRLEMQRSYEEALQADAQQLLDRSLGPGRGVVTVRVDMNFDELETETEAYDTGAQDDGVPRSATTLEESYTTQGEDASAGAVPGAVANVPGADTNIPPGVGDSTVASSTEYTRSETTTNFEVGRTVTRSSRAPGDVERVFLSLVLDEVVSEEQAATLTEAVSAAVGIDEARGDTVAVSRLAFDTSAADEAAQAFAADGSTSQILTYVRMALPVVVLIAAFIFFRLLMRSVESRGYRVVEAPQAALAGADGGAALPAGAAQQALPAPPPLRDAAAELEQRVGGLVQQQPQHVADVVQAWIRED